MFNYIVANIFIISAGTVLYLVARSLPRVEDNGAPRRQNILDRWVASEIPERIDATINSVMGKLLRKLKVFLLKIDNLLTEKLRRVTVKNGKSSLTGNHFKEIAGDKTEKAVPEEKKAQ